MPIKKYLLVLCSAITVMAADQEQPTPYDLIRPVFPLTWDSTVFDRYDTTVTTKHNMVPKNRTPLAYAPNALIPDTLNQAYLDAINVRMSPIRVNQAGYLPDDPECQFYYIGTASKFEVVDIDGKSLSPAVTGDLVDGGAKISSDWTIIAGTNAATNDQLRYQVDISGQSGSVMVGNIPSGQLEQNVRYRIKVGNDISSTFIISDRVYSMVKAAALKFYGINRSGNGESWFHPASHMKDGAGGIVVNPASTDGARGSYNAALAGTLQGGYYDCGDHLKESLTQMYAFMVAAVMAATNPEADEDNYAYNQGETVNTDGIPDMLREAKHGADFVLRAFVRANGVIDDMALSVGTFGSDHGWWGRPENQDNLPVNNTPSATDRGGPASRAVRLGEVGSTVGGETAAGLAILGKLYAEYDKPFADSCLMVAKKMYDFAKNLMLKKGSYDGGKAFKNHLNFKFDSEAYNGNNEAYDDLALAAVALHYATYEQTGDMSYFNDVVQNKEFSTTQEQEGNGFFDGGWMAYTRDGMRKSMKNTSWANVYTFALYALYKLLLKDDETALKYGISTETTKAVSPRTRLWYAENVALILGTNLASESNYNGPTTIQISIPNLNNTPLTLDGTWYAMQTDQTWIYNRYQTGNIFEVLAYADVTKDLETIILPQHGTTRDWHSLEMHQLGIKQLNYMLGVNPWDVSFVLGIGDKNDAHPHHRAANPEGKNVPGAGYKYNPPTGALFGGVAPGSTNSWVPSNKSWEDYRLSETCIDAAATLVSVGMLASKKVDRTTPPNVNVEIRHVSMDSALVVVKLSTRGTAQIYYGTSDNISQLTDIASPDSNKAGVYHEIILRQLTAGTTYNFFVVGTNAYSPDSITTKFLVDSTQTPFTFTTLNTIEAADIQNVTICNLTADSAEIMWYTPNGEYESKVYWDTVPHTNANEFAWNTGARNADVSGIPTSFHYVKIGGLKEKTTYYYMVESNGVQTNVNDDGNILKFTTPVGWYDFSVRAYQYIADGGLDFLDVNIYNNESRSFDSLTLRLYVTATPDQIEVIPQASAAGGAEGSCPMMVDSDICQAYDEAGFNKPCENDRELRDNLRGAPPVRLEDTYNASTGTYDYYIPINLGSTIIKSSSRLRFDVRFSQGIHHYGQGCDPLVMPAKKRLSKNSSDWSWRPHSRLDDGMDYDGMPVEDKDYGDLDNEVPVNPYIAVYRKDEFIWGYSPSYQEMTTKKAHYQVDVTYDPPFNVSNGSFVEIDQTSKTVYVTGHAHVTEGGYITKIWVNGKKVDATYIAFDKEPYLIHEDVIIASYNATTALWDLKIPVRMGVGSNKIDITVFVGPNPECDQCTENGGCAFDNRNYYVQFTRPNMSDGILTVKDLNGGVVGTNGVADPDSKQQFYVHLTDKDKANSQSQVTVKVINAKKQDTLTVLMEKMNDEGVFRSKSPITAVPTAKGNRGANEISFFSGDTIYVEYQDPDDEEDYSRITAFYAESTYPTPQKALAIDTDCDNVADAIQVVFSNTLDDNYAFETIKVFMDGMSDTASIKVPQPVTGKNEVIVPIDTSLGFTPTATPSGTAVVELISEGVTTSETVKITDGIAPTLLSVTILENVEHQADTDVVIVAFTEPVLLNSQNSWPLSIGTIDQSPITVKKVSTDNDGKSWKYIITGNTKGTLIPVGNKAQIKIGAGIMDKAFNELDPTSVCAQGVTIAETPAPVPVELAVMTDYEGDGFADELSMKFKRKLRDKDMLDSFVVDWGSTSVVKSFYPKDWEHTFELSSHYSYVYDTDTASTSYGKVLDSTLVTDSISIITIKFTTANGFPQGATAGAYGGTGKVKPRLGPEGGFFDIDYVVNDKCPPILMSAKTSNNGTYTTLTVTSSEPLVADSSSLLEYIERKRASTAGVYLRSSKSVKQNGLNQLYIYEDEAEDAVHSGDSIRLVPEATLSRYKDAAGNFPTSRNPWRNVTGNVGNTRFIVTMLNGVAKSTGNVSNYGAYAPAEGESFRLTVNKNGTNTLMTFANGTATTSDITLDSNTYKHIGPTFNIDLVLPAANLRDTTGKTDDFINDVKVTFSAEIFDNLGQFINSQEINIDAATVREIISDDGEIHLSLEWMAKDGDAPISKAGKKIATGAYIAKFEFKATETNIHSQESTSTKDDTTKTFGFKRGKTK